MAEGDTCRYCWRRGPGQWCEQIMVSAWPPNRKPAHEVFFVCDDCTRQMAEEEAADREALGEEEVCRLNEEHAKRFRELMKSNGAYDA